MEVRLSILFTLFFFCVQNAFAQHNFVIVNSVKVTGNKVTKLKIIERELDLMEGDTVFIDQLGDRLKENEKRILNTGLFNNIRVNLINWDTETNTADVDIQLQENWYIYPAPIFELADRNFNVWWKEHNRSLSRVNYGLRLSHINFTGHLDQLKLVAQFGYTRKFEAEYNYPYINKKQTIGLSANIFYSENKEIGYITTGNKTQFHKEDDERILLRRFRLSARAHYRSKLYHFHTLKLEYHNNSVDDIVSQDLNPDYFLNGSNRLKFMLLEYNFKYDKSIFRLYPEGGYIIEATLKKEGLGLLDDYNNLSISLALDRFFKIKEGFIAATRLKGKANLIRDKLAFANNTGLGYGTDIIGGYELYVLDGTDYILGQTSLRLKFFEKTINYGKFMPLQHFRRMKFKIYLAFNVDFGYVNEPSYAENNDLNNKWVVGYGPALDFVLFHNYLFQLEYSFNEFGESGLFIHNKVSF